MLRIAMCAVMALVLGNGSALAQDIPGIEDCTKASGLDKRTGCFQSNINYLQQAMMKNAAEARQRLAAANSEIAALKGVVAEMRASLDRMQSEAKKTEPKSEARPETKPEAKP